MNRHRESETFNRTFDRNMPPMQRMVQGQMAGRNNLQQGLRQGRSVQPGNEMRRVLRIGQAPGFSGT